MFFYGTQCRMNALSCGEESMTIYSAVLIRCQRVTDGQTDRQTDVQPIAITCFSIADARKNHIKYANYISQIRQLFKFLAEYMICSSPHSRLYKSKRQPRYLLLRYIKLRYPLHSIIHTVEGKLRRK